MTTAQQPLQSGFGFHSTAEAVMKGVDLSGKTAIVTGGYSGIGLETTRVLALAGASVIVPVRDTSKARQALAGIPRVEQARLDLFDPASVNAFASDFEASGRPLHLLINNAAIMAVPLSRDSRGYESQLSVNHLGHFQLVKRLLPSLRRAQGARVVALSSGAHRRAAFDFDDPNFNQREYNKWISYAQSKTAIALFAIALDQLEESEGVRAFSVHPGRIETDLQRHISLQDLQAMGFRDENGEIFPEQLHTYKTIAQGAATTVWCATNPMLEGRGGVYCEDCDIARAVPADHKPANGVLPWAADPNLAEKLWALSERLVG
ncbi:oxidoreductase [Burkholderia cenocepacia]|uniref:oxidoreductase n=1 Tax=Burkholderia cenocepacia TaxID=95486 RepID=UPI00075ABDA5|nr:oxidoreductase [Burkholderia cenocepacia]AOK37810.1 oxidoreductase [Burkholderia cenocepacia]KWF51068.1 oxidoreductase [Burkholderia cenocepacia]MDF0504658.1 oxidoreductase [Burkholderia cenocepacia]